MSMHRSFRFYLLAMAVTPHLAAAQITLDQPNGPIVLVGGSGSGVFTLHNGGDAGAPPKVGTVVDKTTLAVLSDATVDLQMAADPKQAFPTSIAKNQDLQLRAVVKNVKGASAVAISLFNGSESIEKQLDAYADDAPLNVAISGDGASGTPLMLSLDKPAFVTLKNGDAQAYTLQWRFLYRELELCGTVALLGNGSARIQLEAGNDVYSWTDRIRPSSQTGHLELGLDTGESRCKTAPGKGGGTRPTLPTRDLPVSLTMQLLSPQVTPIFTDGYVIICLIIGGILSLLLSTVLPNSLRKSAFRRQLKDLAVRTTGVSLRVDSNLRVLLRLERNRIGEALRSTWLFSPGASASLDDVANQIDQLTKRLGVAERIDDLRLKLESSYETSPPSVVETVDAALQAAADAMHSYTLSSADIDGATKSLDAAAKSLGTLDNSDDLAKELAGKFTELNTRLGNFLPYYQDLWTAMPGIFGVLLKPFGDPKQITPRMVYSIDYCIAAVNTALDFAVVRQEMPVPAQAAPAPATGSASAGTSQGQTSPLQQPPALIAATPGASKVDAGAAAEPKLIMPHPPNDVVNKARKHLDELTQLLSSMAWQSLREARLLVQEMREGAYQDDVLAELTAGRARVAFETMTARPYLPINFYVKYLKWGRETRAAMERLSFDWTFPGKLQEEGTRVCHYFTGKEKEDGTQTHKKKPEATSGSFNFTGFLKGLFPGIFKPTRNLSVEVTVNPRTSLPGNQTVAGPTLKSEIALESAESNRDSSRIFAEALRFAIAFGVALAGLLSGGIAQIGKLDLVPATLAIIGLGFGADAVKNVLTQPSPPTAAKKTL